MRLSVSTEWNFNQHTTCLLVVGITLIMELRLISAQVEKIIDVSGIPYLLCVNTEIENISLVTSKSPLNCQKAQIFI